MSDNSRGSANQNGWNEWSRHVLKELERQGNILNDLSSNVTEMKAKLRHFDPERVIRLQMELENLKKSDVDQETRIRNLEQESAAAQVNVTLAGVSQQKISALEAKLDDLDKKNIELEKREAKLDGKRVVIGFIAVLVMTSLVNLMFDYFKNKNPQKIQSESRLKEAELKELRRPSK